MGYGELKIQKHGEGITEIITPDVWHREFKLHPKTQQKLSSL